ncbi:MAG: pyruvate formate lyase-activating protein [Deltaproteobacteria bacterium]|nr:pyruvate formate lyase-activating protein [Deltaproteobacteria bacterium]MBN2671827.1 pyruvate formate lyase-activating protein [Deltaproteobacteria bacterium]
MQTVSATKPGSDVGYIHSVDSCGTVDGPGVRFIVFTSGCPLRCVYCHNPDALCKTNGLQRSVDDLLDEIGTYAEFIKRANGGITVSGGEPLSQHRFVEALFRGAKKRYGLHTALDTSGHGNLGAVKSLLDVTDLVLLDIKSWNPNTYQQVTGQKVDSCLQFARLLQERKQPTWIRYVLVPGVTDAPDNLRGLAEFLRGMNCVERIELLSFHKMGEYKWEELGIDYTLKDVLPPTREQILSAAKILHESGRKVVSGLS